MGQSLNRLSPLAVTRSKAPGLMADGGGLYLQVTHAKARSWVFHFTLNGRAREMGLGSLETFTLAEARERARRCRQLLHDGIDPIEERDAKRAEKRLEAARGVTFSKCAEAYIEAQRPGWRNHKHAEQWTSTLATYVEPICGSLPVAAIDTAVVTKILEPIWNAKPETARRVRGRVESVLNWATVRGYRQGDNPARWRGHLDQLLPARGKVRRVRHHPALPYAELPDFLRELREQDGTAARALEFLILTAARTGEVIGARESEVTRKERLWKVPAERIKGGKEHRVPLSTPALALIISSADDPSSFLFAGGKPGQPLSNMAMLQLLKRMERGDLTAHGFRSTFRDWCAERTNYPHEVAEMALAHTVADRVEAAYRRGDLFEKRRRLMDEWARYCASSGQKAGKAVAIRAG